MTAASTRTARDRISRFARQLTYLPFAIRLVRRAVAGWMPAWLLLLVAQGVLPVASVYLVRYLVNGVVDASAGSADWQAFQPVAAAAIALALVMILAELLRSAGAYVRTAMSELVRDHISELIHDQALRVDLAFYDSPHYYDRLHRARYEAASRPLALLENLGSLFQNSLTLFGMLFVLLPYAWWLPLALIGSTLPAFYVILNERLRLHRWHMRSTALERRAWYYFSLLTGRENAAEIRVFDLGAYFRSKFRAVRRKLRGERIDLARRQSLAELFAGGSALGVTGLTVLWMLYRTVQGLFSFGDLALFYQAFNQGQQIVRTLLSNMSEIYTNSLFLTDLEEFLNFMPQVTDPESPLSLTQDAPSIRFEGVTFRYPGSQRIALDRFDLTIPAGKTVAIVGANGAGKSTFIKLLCRFYDPEAGAVMLNERDLRDYALRDLRSKITVLFQEPVRYNASAEENIWLGDTSSEIDRAKIRAAATDAGAQGPIEQLSRGYETLLGKWFDDGADLSVGEWQRVALARAYLRQAPIMVLDEPTSAMDPWAETDWLRRFRRLAHGRTSILITHRFTTAMYADIIHVMDEGRIIESGSHEQLLLQRGRYAESWSAQMAPQAAALK